MTMRSALIQNTIRNSYKELLKKEWADENIRFWEDVESFREQSTKNNKNIERDAKRIYDQYFSEKSSDEINVPHNSMINLKEKISKQEYDADMYDAVQQAVFSTMIESFNRWKVEGSKAEAKLESKLEGKKPILTSSERPVSPIEKRIRSIY